MVVRTGYALGGQYNQDIVTNIANCCSSIAVSEFSQIDHIQNLKTTPEDYISIVKGKTAGPFASGCRSAGIVADASKEQLFALEEFGNEIGIAYQLVDDLLDLLGDDQIGKPQGTDVHEGKMTLPLIHSLTLSHGKNRDRLAEIINNFNDDLLDELIELLEKSDSFNYTKILIRNHFERQSSISAYSQNLMQSYCSRMLQNLLQLGNYDFGNRCKLPSHSQNSRLIQVR